MAQAFPILVLQHPQEAKAAYSTVRTLVPLLADVEDFELRVRVGLSWRSLSKAWGNELLDPAREWIVFYMSSSAQPTIPLTFLGKKPSRAPAGLVFLDGTWKQVKTLWWRNPWLLKLSRAVLAPPQPSSFRFFRKSVTPLGLSTAEAILFALEQLGRLAPQDVQEKLWQGLTQMPEQIEDGPR